MPADGGFSNWQNYNLPAITMKPSDAQLLCLDQQHVQLSPLPMPIQAHVTGILFRAGPAPHADKPNAAQAASAATMSLSNVSFRLDCMGVPQYLGEKMTLQGRQALASQLTAVQPGTGCQAGRRLFQEGSHGFQNACFPAAPWPTHQQSTWHRCFCTSKLPSAA